MCSFPVTELLSSSALASLTVLSPQPKAHRHCIKFVTGWGDVRTPRKDRSENVEITGRHVRARRCTVEMVKLFLSDSWNPLPVLGTPSSDMYIIRIAGIVKGRKRVLEGSFLLNELTLDMTILA